MKTGLASTSSSTIRARSKSIISADIFLKKDERQVNAKSIMGIMSLAIAHGTTITLIAEGSDEEQALTSLAALVEDES